MNLVLNEEETMIKDAANDFLVENAGPDHLRNLRDDPDSKGIFRKFMGTNDRPRLALITGSRGIWWFRF